MKRQSLILYLFLLGFTWACKGKREITYQNPLPVAFGDPFILHASDGRFYMYGTGGVVDGFKAYVSDDLVNWTDHGCIYQGNTDGQWCVANFWAPEVYEIGGKYYLWFSADWRENPTNAAENFRIGIAVADHPAGPFIDLMNRPVFDPGYPIIDANLLFDNGRVYLYYSRCCYKHPVESEIADWARAQNLFDEIEESWVYGVELQSDFLDVIGEPVLLLRPPVSMADKQAEWESRSVTSREVNRRWTEGSFIFKEKDTYYMMYSANFFGGQHYAVGYATSKNPLGSFVKADNNPVLQKNTDEGGVVTGTGHNMAFVIDGKMYCVYHGRTEKTEDERMVFIDPMEILPDGKLVVYGPNTDAQTISYSCTGPRPIPTCDTYTEAADPASDSLADWSKIPQRLNVSFGSIDTRYAKSSIPAIEQTTSWQGSGWRGERVSAQVVLWSSADIAQVECAFTPFRSGKNTLDADIAQARFVRYVLTDIFEPVCRCCRDLDKIPSSLSADMLDTLKCFNLEANTARPVWLTFDIPADAQPGIYKGTLSIYARKHKTQKLNISLEVLPQTLPAPKDWKFHLDLWQHPAAVARVHNVKPWSEEHWLLLESEMKMLANAGQKVITTTLNKDPWNHQCYDAYEDMVIWTKNADGAWAYDYAVFDRWVELMMQLGVTRMINCYSIIPWNNELRYYDASDGKHVDVSARPGTKEFTELWTPFLTDFRRHLDEKGWLQITNIAMDERSPEDMKATLDLLHKVAPEFGVSLADNHKSYRQYPYIKDISVFFGATFDESDLAYRKQNGLNSTYYICCAHEFPNVFTFSDPAEGAYIAWYAVAAGLDGFLRWAYNSWLENPVIDSRSRTLAGGDTYIVYPGVRSSIRFERLREGIQDAEKIRILREQLATAELARLNEEVEKFNINHIPPIPCSEMLHNGKKIIEELSR